MTPLLLILAVAMALACSLLSVFVVLRRWAFIGEGIAHAGFGGAGTAWLVALLLPTPFLHSGPGIFLVAISFCMVVAFAIGYFTRREVVHSDTVIGIFLVASLAWGFIAQGIYKQHTRGLTPPDAEAYLIGSLTHLPPPYALAAIAACAAIVTIVLMFGREIVSYCFDPTLAEVSGVRVGFIHYLMIFLVALTIIIGMRIMGSLLVTALLVLPGAAALQVSRNLRTVLFASLCVGLIAAIAGPLTHSHAPFIPVGPAIVMVLVIEFLAVYAWRTLARR